jgi:hypothetical protein
MPRRPRHRRDQSRALGTRFRRMLTVAARRRRAGAVIRMTRRRLRLSATGPPPQPPPRPDSLERLRLKASDWRALACHLYRLLRRHDPPLADLLWHHAWQVDQGLRQSLSVEPLPSSVPAARRVLNASKVRQAYKALMHDLHGGPWRPRRPLRGGHRKPPLATLSDQAIVNRIMGRLLTIVEPADVPPWPWEPDEAPWPRLIVAVRQHAPQAAALDILAWALDRKVSYLKRLIERKSLPLGL